MPSDEGIGRDACMALAALRELSEAAKSTGRPDLAALLFAALKWVSDALEHEGIIEPKGKGKP